MAYDKNPSEEFSIPPSIPKFISDILLGGGLLVYLVWTIAFLIPEGKIFDIGLFSISIVVILFGLVGHYHYKNLEEVGKKK